MIFLKNVLITGASRGIGRACAEKFAAEGFRVFANYNNSEANANELAEKTGVIPIRADVSDAAQVEKMAEIINAYGGVDILVNNAGIAQQKLFTDITEEDWDRMFDINVKGMYLVTKSLIPGMINKKCGKIINVSSMWGVTGGSCEVHYSAAKAAVIGFTKALAKELGPSGIQVNCIAPGVIDTDMNNNLTEEDIAWLSEETPLGRTGTAAETAELIYFLASEKADFITGQVIGNNGGLVV